MDNKKHRCKKLKEIDPNPITVYIAYSNGHWWLDFLEKDLVINIDFCPWCGKKLGYIEIK